MSAFVVGNDHINALLNWAIHHQVSYYLPATKERVQITAFSATEVGQILLDANERSVGIRYPDDHEMPRGHSEAFAFKLCGLPRLKSAVQIIKACHCLDYQCCEADDWEGTIAHRIMSAILSAATHEVPGYAAAQWEITA